MRNFLILLLSVSLLMVVGSSPIQPVEGPPGQPRQPIEGTPGQQHEITFTNQNDKLFLAKLDAAKQRVVKELTENPHYLANDLEAQQYLKNRWGFNFDVVSLALLLNGAQDERLVMTPQGLTKEHTAGVDLIWEKFTKYLNVVSKL